ncbi:hypothetical protein [Pseudoalteromonas xiamenensis]
MIELSTQTILIMSAISIITSAIALTFLWMANRDIKATAYWAIAPWLLFVNFSFFALQNVLPDFMRFVLSNWCGQLSFLLILLGIYQALCNRIPVGRGRLLQYFCHAATQFYLHLPKLRGAASARYELFIDHRYLDFILPF